MKKAIRSRKTPNSPLSHTLPLIPLKAFWCRAAAAQHPAVVPSCLQTKTRTPYPSPIRTRLCCKVGPGHTSCLLSHGTCLGLKLPSIPTSSQTPALSCFLEFAQAVPSLEIYLLPTTPPISNSQILSFPYDPVEKLPLLFLPHPRPTPAPAVFFISHELFQHPTPQISLGLEV